MKKKYFNLFVFLFIITTLLIFNSCSAVKNKNFSPIKYDESIARIVKSVTNGVIAPDSQIYINFQNDIIPGSLVGKIEKNRIFNFEPELKGKILWKSTNSIAFIPNSLMEEGKIYKCSVNLSNLVENEDKLLKFNFLVKKIEITSFKSEFLQKDGRDSKTVIFQANCEFSQPVEMTELETAFKLNINGKTYNLKPISEDVRSNVITLTSENIIKSSKDEKGIFIFNPSKNRKFNNFKKEIKLYSYKKFEPISSGSEIINSKVYLYINFSNNIDETQDFRGYVDIYPEVDFNVYASGSKLILAGNFKPGNKYKVILRDGLKAKSNNLSLNAEGKNYITIKTKNLSPSIQFTSGGIFLPSDNTKKIRFNTINLSSARLIILKVFENNLCQFLQDNSVKSNSKNRHTKFNSLNRVGVEIYNEKINFDSQIDEYCQHEIDLSKIIEKDNTGIYSGVYIVSLFYQKDDIISSKNNEEQNNNSEEYESEYEEEYEGEYEEDYEYYGYNQQNSSSDYYSMTWNSIGQIHKAITLSDIGLIVLMEKDRVLVHARDIITTEPVQNAEISLISYQNQVINKGFTDKEGKIYLNLKNMKPFYILAIKDGQRSFVSIDDMTLNLSNYDVGGIELSKSNLRFYAYTERGIYRPGDEINITAIIRNENDTFLDNHPVILKMYNPKNNLVYEKINKEGTDGVYVFNIKTSANDLTGNWIAEFNIVNERFTLPIKIETIVPYTIKAIIKSSEPILIKGKIEKTTLDIDVKYLVGLPASGLSYSLDVEYVFSKKKFDNLPEYVFDDISYKYESLNDRNIASGILNSEGKATINYKLPYFDSYPSTLICVFILRVIEKSGRPAVFKIAIPVEFYNYFVGYKLSSSYGAYLKPHSKLDVSIIDLTSDGKFAEGRKIKWTSYHSYYWWWWDYYYGENAGLNFKNSHSTEIVKKGDIVSKNGPVTLTLSFEEYGTYYIELEDEEGGHKSSFFIFVYGWGGSDSNAKDADFLILRSDKNEYNPGQNAKITFPCSDKGKVFISIEHSNKIIKDFWLKAQIDSNQEMSISIPLDNSMTPNIYVSILYIQPHSETGNDRPIRMYGIIPIKVIDKSTKQEITIKTDEEIKPNSKFKIEIQTKDKEESQVTIAVVDEGLLDLTAFETPDPWKEFNKKLKMSTQIIDLYDNIINLNTGEVKNRFAIGGSDSFTSKQSANLQAQRFEAVSFFKGPLKTDKNGYLMVEFKMPNYLGSVRIMVISIKGKKYGMAEKTIKVRQELMVTASLPRILRPTDYIEIPVTILGMVKNLGKISIRTEVEGVADIVGDKKQEITMSEEGEKTLLFYLQAKESVGLIKFKVYASNGTFSSYQITELDCVAASARITEENYFTLKAGEKKKIKIPKIGIEGSNSAEILITSYLPKNIQKRLSYLIHYPYGCLEQTTSSAFPQLFLPDLIELSINDKEKIDNNINAAIKKIQKHQMQNGAFSFWLNGTYYYLWTNNYAAHFLIEAKNKGYNVDPDVIQRWKNFTKKNLKNISTGSLIESVYSCYLLALSGDPDIGAMNVIWSTYKDELSEPFKLLLAASYKLSGFDKVVNNIIMYDTKRLYTFYDESDYTFGSEDRDLGIKLLSYLELLNLYESNNIFKKIIEKIQSDYLYNTQETSFLLLSLGKYVNKIFNDNIKGNQISGKLLFPSGKIISFSSQGKNIKIPIDSEFDGDFIIEIDPAPKTNVPLLNVYVTMHGIPLLGYEKTIENKLKLNIIYYDENGVIVNNNKFIKGKQYWVKIVIERKENFNYRNIAIAHILPAGLEYEQYRFTRSTAPSFDNSKWKAIVPDYIDIRDDRAFIFTNINWWDQSVFYLKVNAVTAGKFILPSSYAEAMYERDIFASTAGGFCEVINSSQSNPLAKPKN